MVATLKALVKPALKVLLVIAGIVVFVLFGLPYLFLGVRTVVDWTTQSWEYAWTGPVPGSPRMPLLAAAIPTPIPVVKAQMCQFEYGGFVLEQPFGAQPVQHDLSDGRSIWIICDHNMLALQREVVPTAVTRILPPPASSGNSSSRTFTATGACANQAKVLGPFSNGQTSESFTINADEGVVHLSFWIPGQTPEGAEYSILLQSGTYHFLGGGQAWQFIGCRDIGFATADAIEHGKRRSDLGKVFSLMSVEQLKAQYPDSVSW